MQSSDSMRLIDLKRLKDVLQALLDENVMSRLVKFGGHDVRRMVHAFQGVVLDVQQFCETEIEKITKGDSNAEISTIEKEVQEVH